MWILSQSKLRSTSIVWALSQSKRGSIWDPKFDRSKSVNGSIVDFTASRITVGLKTVSMLNSLQILCYLWVGHPDEILS